MTSQWRCVSFQSQSLIGVSVGDNTHTNRNRFTIFCTSMSTATATTQQQLNTNNNSMADVFFETKPCLALHVYHLLHHQEAYLCTLTFLCKSGTFGALVSSATKARVLAALHILKLHKSVSSVLRHCEVMHVLKALQLLDKQRKIQQLSKKITSIERKHPHLKVPDNNNDNATKEGQKRRGKRNKKGSNKHDDDDDKPKRQRHRRMIDTYRLEKRRLVSEVADETKHDCVVGEEDSGAVQEWIASGSVSGALARKVREWARTTQSKDFLEFVLLGMPTQAWREIADLVHFGPNDFALPYFLHELYRDDKADNNKADNDDKADNNNKTEPDPKQEKPEEEEEAEEEETFVSCMREFLGTVDRRDDMEERFVDVIAPAYPQVYLNYSLLRRYDSITCSKRVMENLAGNIPLDTLLWYYEEFHAASRECESIVQNRLAQGVDEL